MSEKHVFVAPKRHNFGGKRPQKPKKPSWKHFGYIHIDAKIAQEAESGLIFAITGAKIGQKVDLLGYVANSKSRKLKTKRIF